MDNKLKGRIIDIFETQQITDTFKKREFVIRNRRTISAASKTRASARQLHQIRQFSHWARCNRTL